MSDMSDNTVYKFSAAWCQPCKQMAPLIARIKAEFPGIKIVDCDVEADADLAREFSVQSVPTLVTRSGHKLVGAATEHKLRSWFDAVVAA